MLGNEAVEPPMVICARAPCIAKQSVIAEQSLTLKDLKLNMRFVLHMLELPFFDGEDALRIYNLKLIVL